MRIQEPQEPWLGLLGSPPPAPGVSSGNSTPFRHRRKSPKGAFLGPFSLPLGVAPGFFPSPSILSHASPCHGGLEDVPQLSLISTASMEALSLSPREGSRASLEMWRCCQAFQQTLPFWSEEPGKWQDGVGRHTGVGWAVRRLRKGWGTTRALRQGQSPDHVFIRNSFLVDYPEKSVASEMSSDTTSPAGG